MEQWFPSRLSSMDRQAATARAYDPLTREYIER